MPREEQLPPSKEGRLSDEITFVTYAFNDSLVVAFSQMSTDEKFNFIIDHFNKKEAISDLIIEVLTERIELLENS